MKHVFFSTTAAALLALALPAVSFAQSTTAAPAMAPASAPASAPMASSAPALSKADEAKLDAHIKSLHDELKITASEEPQWNAFATVMRENDANLHQAFAARANVASMTAEQNMATYANIAATHAEDMQKLSAAFSTLYDSFPDAQKKIADQVFQNKTAAHTHKS
jgi:hypothetical protein